MNSSVIERDIDNLENLFNKRLSLAKVSASVSENCMITYNCSLLIRICGGGQVYSSSDGGFDRLYVCSLHITLVVCSVAAFQPSSHGCKSISAQ